MTCNITCVDATSTTWPSTNESSPGSHPLGSLSKRTYLSTSSPTREDNSSMQHPNKQNRMHHREERWLAGPSPSPKTDPVVVDRWSYSHPTPYNDNGLAGGLDAELSPCSRRDVDTLGRPTPEESNQRYSNQELYSSGGSEGTAHCMPPSSNSSIPRIHLEPPPSSNNNSTLGTKFELSNLPPQNGLLFTDFLLRDDTTGRHNLMTSSDRSPQTPVTLPCRYQRCLQEDTEEGDAPQAGVPDPQDDICRREEDLGTALKWIRQEIVRLIRC